MCCICESSDFLSNTGLALLGKTNVSNISLRKREPLSECGNMSSLFGCVHRMWVVEQAFLFVRAGTVFIPGVVEGYVEVPRGRAEACTPSFCSVRTKRK